MTLIEWLNERLAGAEREGRPEDGTYFEAAIERMTQLEQELLITKQALQNSRSLYAKQRAELEELKEAWASRILQAKAKKD